MKLEKIIWILLVSFLLTNCSTHNRSHIGAGLGATTTTGTELLYKSDYDVHNAVFVDHLNKGTSSSYTNWYNDKSGNSGNIKTYSTYIEEGFKCKDYEAAFDITNQWPLIGIGGINRKVYFGTACQLPDGRWVEKQ